MLLSRRQFVELVGVSAPVTAVLPGPATGWGRADPIRLDSNENPYGPFPSARAAVARVLGHAGRYPGSSDLVAAIARANGVASANVMLTVGATEGLVIAARAFTAPDRALITAAPTYAAIATATEQLRHPVIRVPIGADGHLDLEAMTDRARGAGLVYVCNPNNPTGTLHPAVRIREFLRSLSSTEPRAAVVIGEVYHEYIDAPDHATMVPEALANPQILINRTFSKLYGLAGMRLGYLIGHEETLRKLAAHRVPIGANAIAIAAAMASLADEAERIRQRDLNTAGRRRAEAFFRELGLQFHRASANYLFVEVGRNVAAFRTELESRGLLIGRPYPPADTWARITIGTPAEMEAAFAILRDRLTEGRRES